jgi:hypothetical protein
VNEREQRKKEAETRQKRKWPRRSRCGGTCCSLGKTGVCRSLIASMMSSLTLILLSGRGSEKVGGEGGAGPAVNVDTCCTWASVLDVVLQTSEGGQEGFP